MGKQEVVAFFHFWLVQPASAGHRLKQLGVATRTWEGGGKKQPSQPCAIPSDGSFCAALRKQKERLVWALGRFGSKFSGLKQTLERRMTFLAGEIGQRQWEEGCYHWVRAVQMSDTVLHVHLAGL